MADLASIADELYALPPSEFVAARNARAAELRDDRDLADAVRALRRPAPAAWVANLLSRDDDLERVTALGDRLRAAQDSADRAALTALSRERRELVRELAGRASALAAAAGHPVAQPVLDLLGETLQAAMADPDAAAAVRTGRLLRPLASIGFEPVDLTDAVAAPGGASAPPPKRHKLRAVTDPEAELRRARADADAAVAQAREAADRAEAGIRDLADRADEVDRRRDELQTEVADLESDLRDARRGLAEAERELQRLDRDRGTAERRADAARAALAKAEQRRSRLEG
ncbi:MAG TPA: transposase [Pseudolysinimonas sp.]|nr:transposase [Pseudolysinimonas sp.]